MFQQKILRVELPGRMPGGRLTDAVREEIRLDGVREEDVDGNRCSCGQSARGLDCADVKVSYLVQLLFGNLLSDWCVVLLQVQNKSQQATFSLVAHLLSQTSLHVRRLRRTEKKQQSEAPETKRVQNVFVAEDSPGSLRYRHC